MEIKLCLAHNGKSPYMICIPPDADETERFAAEELQRFFAESTGVLLPVISSFSQCDSAFLLCVGRPPKPRKNEESVLTDDLNEESIRIKTLGGRVIITGGRPRGVLYAVYQFLEDYLGCRWFTPECSHVPRHATLEIPQIDFTYIPPFAFRRHNCALDTDALWAARNRLNGHMGENLPSYGGIALYDTAHHSFSKLVPPEKYFDEHPEYFSEVDSVRLRERTQLCLSNPDVLQICIEGVKEMLRKSPFIPVYVGQNDCLNPCQCEKCRQIDAYEGAFSGSVIRFVNKIGEAIEEEFPGRQINTFAYRYSQAAPKYARPRSNVAVTLCSIESCFAHPLNECSVVRRDLSVGDAKAHSFAQDLSDWSKICENLYIWDYVTNFRNFVYPHPNLPVLGPNIRFFRDMGVKYVFEQGCRTSRHGEFQELRGYVISRLLWNPDADDRALIREFCDAYYKMAAGPVLDYLDLLAKEMQKSGNHLFMSTMPNSPDNRGDAIRSSLSMAKFPYTEDMPDYALAKYITPELLDWAKQLFDHAEGLADNDEILERVRIARMPIRFSEFMCMPLSDPRRDGLLEAFFHDAVRFGIGELKEGIPLINSYRALKQAKHIY